MEKEHNKVDKETLISKNLLSPPNPKCRDCDLCKSATNAGIPVRPLYDSQKISHTKAVLIVGEAPGHSEDKAGKSWVGRSGQLLKKFTEAAKFPQLADVYLGNSCRCRPPQNDKPSKKQRDTCFANLLHDITSLSRQYEEVIILCCGASATSSITNSQHSIKTAIKHQGAKLKQFINHTRPNITTFFTYHPAILMPGRKPALIHAVESHFILISKYLSGEASPNKLPFQHHIHKPCPTQQLKRNIKHITVDIETYGILKGQDQTVFHPDKALHVDKIDRGRQIVSVAFALQLSNGKYEAYSYSWDNPEDRRHIRTWFKTASDEEITVIGQNIPFDISFLAKSDHLLSFLLNPRRLKLDDTLILSFLLYDQRPERGLKELSKLLGIFNYSSLTLTAKSGTAKRSDDPALHKYNAIDAVATFMLFNISLQRIKTKYGPLSSKLKPTCKEFRNESLWNVITMQKHGVVLNLKELQKIHTELVERTEKLSADLLKQRNIVVSGKGSEKSKREYLQNVINRLKMTNDDRISYTEKTGKLSLAILNLEVVRECSPPDFEERPYLDMIVDYVHTSKLITSYTTKLLTDNKRGVVTTIKNQPNKGICYPSWFVTPRSTGKANDASSEGGTIQARYSAKDPAAQTFPACIKKTFTSRFIGGRLIFWDYSQMELRMAALLSNDEPMLDAYNKGADLHALTAMDSIPGADPSNENWKQQRALGKTINFLILYLGGGHTLQKTAYQNLGMEIPLNQCYQMIDNFNSAHPQLRAWQEELLQTAKKKGYVELMSGWSRTYTTGSAAIESYRNEICNHPVQTLAAQVCQSAQYSVICAIDKRRLKTLPFIQIHDSIGFDVHPEELNIVPNIVEKCLTEPPLYSRITRELKRTVSLEIDRED